MTIIINKKEKIRESEHRKEWEEKVREIYEEAEELYRDKMKEEAAYYESLRLERQLEIEHQILKEEEIEKENNKENK